MIYLNLTTLNLDFPTRTSKISWSIKLLINNCSVCDLTRFLLSETAPELIDFLAAAKIRICYI